MSDDLSDLHPDTVNPATLVDRLRGHYRLPIKDGLGPVKGGDEPDNPEEYVRTFGAVPPIHRVAAAEIERLRAALDAAEKDSDAWRQSNWSLLTERDAALAARDAVTPAMVAAAQSAYDGDRENGLTDADMLAAITAAIRARADA